MRRTNRIDPVLNDRDVADLTRATMTTTTRMEFVRHVQVLPMTEAVAQLHSDLNQSLGNEGIISPRIWTTMNLPTTPIAVKSSRRAIWFIGCVFITVAIFALVAVITALTIAFGDSNTIGESNIERFDVGDLRYGMTNVNTVKSVTNSDLSAENIEVVQKYFFDQLSKEPGFRGLSIDGIYVYQNSTSSRKRRSISCSTVFVIRNIQIYFDRCSNCLERRNLAIRDLLTNLTLLQRPMRLSSSARNGSVISGQICSTPNITKLIIPVTLNILQAQQINSSLLTTTSTSATMTTAQTTYVTYNVTNKTTSRSTYTVTSRGGVSPRKITTTLPTTTTTSPLPIETSSSIATSMANNILTKFTTILSDTTVYPGSITSLTTQGTSPISVTDSIANSEGTHMMTTADHFDSTIITSNKLHETSTFQPNQQTTYALSSETKLWESVSIASSQASSTVSHQTEQTITFESIPTTSVEGLSTATYQSEQTTSFIGLSTISSDILSSTSYQTEQTTSLEGLSTVSSVGITLTSSSNEYFSTATTLLQTDATTQFQTVTSTLSSFFTDVTREEISTLDFTKTTTMNEISIATSTHYSEDLTSSTIDDMSTMTDAIYTSTEQHEETFSDFSTTIPLSTATHSNSTEEVYSSTMFDLTTNELATDVSPTLLSTETMTIESTITTNGYITTSFTSSNTEANTITEAISSPSASSFTNTYESTELSITTPQELSSSNQPDTTSLQLDITTSVSTSSMTVTNQENLHESIFTTNIASSPNAYLESSSIILTTISLITPFQTTLDVSSPTMKQDDTSRTDSSQYSSPISPFLISPHIQSLTAYTSETMLLHQDISRIESTKFDTTTVSTNATSDISELSSSWSTINPNSLPLSNVPDMNMTVDLVTIPSQMLVDSMSVVVLPGSTTNANSNSSEATRSIASIAQSDHMISTHLESSTGHYMSTTNNMLSTIGNISPPMEYLSPYSTFIDTSRLTRNKITSTIPNTDSTLHFSEKNDKSIIPLLSDELNTTNNFVMSLEHHSNIKTTFTSALQSSLELVTNIDIASSTTGIEYSSDNIITSTAQSSSTYETMTVGSTLSTISFGTTQTSTLTASSSAFDYSFNTITSTITLSTTAVTKSLVRTQILSTETIDKSTLILEHSTEKEASISLSSTDVILSFNLAGSYTDQSSATFQVNDSHPSVISLSAIIANSDLTTFITQSTTTEVINSTTQTSSSLEWPIPSTDSTTSTNTDHFSFFYPSSSSSQHQYQLMIPPQILSLIRMLMTLQDQSSLYHYNLLRLQIHICMRYPQHLLLQ